MTDAERDGGSAQGLEGQVIAQATGIQVVVHALEDDVARTAAHRPQRLCADLAVVRDVAARQADPDRLARRAAGRLDADDLLERRTLIDAQERPIRLRIRDLALLHEGDSRQILPVANRFRFEAGRVELGAVERTGRVVVGDLFDEALVLEPPHLAGRHGLDRLVPECDGQDRAPLSCRPTTAQLDGSG